MDLCFLLLLVVLLGGCASVQGDTCIAKGCQCTGQTSIDLSGFFNYPITGIPDTTPGNSKYTYSFSPCTPMVCLKGQENNAALCQEDSTNPTGAVSLGSTQNISWSVTSEDEFTLTIAGGTEAEGPRRARESMIKFQYVGNNVSKNEITYLGEADNKDKTAIIYNFAVKFNSAHAVSGAGTAAGIVGIVLIILFIVGVLTYFIVGGLVMYFYKGARGVEVIPNYTFWKDLPVLIKDGFMFTISPCHKVYTDKKGYQAL